MNILNLTQHAATADQIAAGVFEPADKSDVQRLLTFDTLPTREEVFARARALAEVAKRHGASRAMIGGAPFFMSPLERVLMRSEVQPDHAFAQRVSVEEPDGQGGVRKTQIFRHLGFIGAFE
ncbi:MAG: hypothetical protein KBC16_00740 [Candidatus Pacebacteria bacterium]|nr:hypothetical protein [Candidatus Paceibacterota bacterium]